MNNVVLQTKRCILKFPKDISVDEIVSKIDDEDTVRYLSSIPSIKYSENDAKNFIEFLNKTEYSNNCLELGIYIDNEFVGMCSLEEMDANKHSAELGYWLCKKYARKGIMSECADAICKYAKENLEITTVKAFVIKGNKKSSYLLEKLGFKEKSMLKDYLKNKGKYVDVFLYELNF